MFSKIASKAFQRTTTFRIFSIALLLICGAFAAKSADVDLTVVMPTAIPKPLKGPAFAVFDGIKNQAMFCEARFKANGRPLGPRRLDFIDFNDATRSFQIVFDSVGAPVWINFANGSRIRLTEKAGGTKVKMQIYDSSGVVVGTVRNILETTSAGLRAQAAALSPFRIRWQKFAGTDREGITGFFGDDVGGHLADFLDDSCDKANKLIERMSTLAATFGDSAAQVAVVLDAYISDGLGVLANETKSKTVKFIQKAYDLTQSLNSINKFFSEPKVLDVSGLVNSLEDTVNAVLNEPPNLSTEVASDPPSEDPGGGSNLTDPQIKAAIDDTAAVVADALGSIDKPFTFADVTAGILGNFRIKMQRQSLYFTTMSRLVGNCEQVALLLGQMDPGSLRDEAEGTVILTKSSIFDQLNNAFNDLMAQRTDFQSQTAAWQTNAAGALATVNNPNTSADARQAAQQLYEACVIMRDLTQANAQLSLELAREVSGLTQRTNGIVIP